MADEPDGVNEEFDGMLRIGLIVAGRAAESLARMREQAAREARAASEQPASSRPGCTRSGPPPERNWRWRTARSGGIRPAAQDVAGVWETARAWQGLDPAAARAVDHMRAEIRDRFRVDTMSTGPAAVRDALARRGIAPEQADTQRRQAGRDATEAARYCWRR